MTPPPEVITEGHDQQCPECGGSGRYFVLQHHWGTGRGRMLPQDCIYCGGEGTLFAMLKTGPVHTKSPIPPPRECLSYRSKGRIIDLCQLVLDPWEDLPEAKRQAMIEELVVQLKVWVKTL